MTFDRWFQLSSFLLMADGLAALWLAELLGPFETLAFGAGLVLAFRGTGHGLSIRARRIAQRVAIAMLAIFLAADLLYLADSLLHGLIRLLTLLGILKLWLRTHDRDVRDCYIISFFQLVAASAATTNMAFVVVFLAFLFLGVWAFVLLHLKQEGTTLGPEWNAMPARLLPTSVVVSLTALLVAAALFVAIPRVGRAFLLTRAPAGPLVAGFSEKVELGSFGTIQTDSGVVMRVRLTNIRPEEAPRLSLRWRGVAFDRFDGAAWMVSDAEREEIGRSPGGLATIGRPSGRGPLIRQEIALEPIGTDVLFGAPRLIQLLGPFPRLYTDMAGTVTQASPPVGRVRYRAVSELEATDRSDLSVSGGSYPAEILEVYLQLPPVAPRVRALADALAKGARDPFEIARRVETHLRDGYRYSLELKRDSRYDPIEDFLFVQRAGNCEYFAASMAVLLRAASGPARVVNGFQRGEWNEYGGYLAVRQRDAHSWVEVYVPGAGWATFDPSPRASAEPAVRGLLGRLTRYLDALSMHWDRYVVAYSLSDQIRLVSVARRRADLVRERAIDLLGGFRRAMAGALPLLIDGSLGSRLLLLLPAAAIVGVVLGLRQRSIGGHRRVLGGDRSDLRFYRQLLAVLARKGFRREPGVTPLEFAAEVEARGDPDLAGVSQVVDFYYRVRYGERSLSESEHQQIADAIRRFAAASARLPVTSPGRGAALGDGRGAGGTRS